MRQHFTPAFSGKPQYHVCSDGNTRLCRAPHRIDGTSIVMPPIDFQERSIERTLDTILHHHVTPAGKSRQIFEQLPRHAIGPRTDDKPHDTGVSQRFFVTSHKTGHFSISAGIGLKIGQIFHLGIFTSKKSNTFIELLRNTPPRMTVIGAESLVIAVRTTAPPFRAVPIGTRKSRIQRDFLYLIRETGSQIISHIGIKRSNMICHQCPKFL